MSSTARFIRAFDEVGQDDLALAGGKNASLGEMYQQLAASGVRIPEGFVVTTDAYRHVVEQAGIRADLEDALRGLDPDDPADLADRAGRARRLLLQAGLPDDLREEVLAAYRALREPYGDDLLVVARSSATAEDLPEASFAGQHESYLGLADESAVLDAVSRCFASFFTDRAVHYRERHGVDHLRAALSVGIMRMIRADRAASGVMFTLDTESGFRDVVFVTAAYGLGEHVVQGRVDPDEFYVHKPTYARGHRAVLRRRIGQKATRLVIGADGTTEQETPAPQRQASCVTDADVLDLAGQAMTIEAHYGRPMDIEWALDGADGRIYIVQARPETVSAQAGPGVLTRYRVTRHGDVLATGRSVGDRAAVGTVRVIRDAGDFESLRDGEILVARTTTPDWEPVIKRAAAVVTDQGGRTCHAAIVARELGLPAVVGTGRATLDLRDGDLVTVSCADGETGHVYAGRADVAVETLEASDVPRPRTKIMVNLGNPDLAFRTALLPNDGVGLARMEFMITDHIGAHPLALLEPDSVPDEGERESLRRLTAGYPDGATYVVERLSEGIGTIAAAFFPRPVVVRMSDFKSSEYAHLLGGRTFEPVEDNPMLGFRGASRYAHPAYREGFALECAAVRRVREVMGLTNVIVMIPFVRRVAEADLVLARMAELGLARGVDGLQVYAMCEIPNNVVLVDDFAQRFDGYSIGSNDLTQLTLGVDRDNAAVSFDYDERDPGVLRMIELAVRGCQRHGIHTGICGQAPSDYPEVVEFLVGLGIDSISVTPDALVPVRRRVFETEQSAGTGV